jgi:putative hemolysin
LNEIATEIVIVFLLVLVNGLFALSEIAVISARKARLQQRAEDGDKGAQTALALAGEPSRFLSTVQIGITLIGILSGAFGGATLAKEIANALARIEWLAPYSEAIGVAIVVLAITYLSLVIGELVPKRIALNNADRIAARVAPGMEVISRIAAPAVRLLSSSTDLALRLLGVKPSMEPSVTEEEVKMMIYEGTRLGIFEEVEQEIMERVFRLGDRKVSSMMTYRTEIVCLDIEDPLSENLEKLAQAGYSRFPVCRGEPDDILGILLVKDVFAQIHAGRQPDLNAILRPALFIPEAMSALEVLEKFRENKQHVALVVDEFGGITGLVTLNDILEAIVGDVPTVEEGEEPEVVRREDGTLLLDGSISIHDLKDLLDIDKLLDEEEGVYETLGGLVMSHLGKIPEAGDYFDWGTCRFEVMDMDGYRVDKVLVTPQNLP